MRVDKNELLLNSVSFRDIGKKDDFADIVALTEKSLKDVWQNEEDDVWSEYLNDENRCLK